MIGAILFAAQVAVFVVSLVIFFTPGTQEPFRTVAIVANAALICTWLYVIHRLNHYGPR